MNCRRTRSLLSAYIDSELTGVEMLAIRDHMTFCAECRSEHQSLLSLKRLLSALPDKEPRHELVLRLEALPARATFSGILIRLFPEWMVAGGAQPSASSSTQAAATLGFSTNGRRLASACVLGVLSVWFIVAPTARAPRSEFPSGAEGMLTRASLLTPYSLLRFHQYTMNPPVADPIARPVQLQSGRMPWFQAQMLAETRRRRASMLTNAFFGAPSFSQTTYGTVGTSNLEYTGYSVSPSR